MSRPKKESSLYSPRGGRRGLTTLGSLYMDLKNNELGTG